MASCASTAYHSNSYMESSAATATLTTSETEPDEVMEADKALLDPKYIMSEADLYHAKM